MLSRQPGQVRDIGDVATLEGDRRVRRAGAATSEHRDDVALFGEQAGDGGADGAGADDEMVCHEDVPLR